MSTSTLQQPTIIPEPTLTKADRCDSCGSQAFASASFVAIPVGAASPDVSRQGELLFCSHHFTRFNENIARAAIATIDERAFVLPEKGAAGNGFV